MSEGEHTLFNFSTIYWATGWLYLIGGTFSDAKRVITTNTVNPKFMVDVVNKNKVTAIFCPPAYMAELVNHQPTLDKMLTVRHLMSGGSLVPKSLVDAVELFVPKGTVFAVYGK